MNIKKIAFYIILLIGTITIIGIITYSAEAYFSAIDPANKLPKNGVVNGVRYTWGNKVTNNNYGFRDDHDYIAKKVKNSFRIIVLGDSLTWGAGLAVKDRYTNRLETLLKARFPKLRMEVFNLGFMGAPATSYRDRLIEYKDLFGPDLIIVGFCLNDPQPRSQDYSIERKAFVEKWGDTLSHLTSVLGKGGLPFLGKRVEDAVYNLVEKVGLIPPWYVALDRVYDKDSSEWSEFNSALVDIKNVSDEKTRLPPIFIVLNQGTYADRPTDYNHPDPVLEYYLKWYAQAEGTAKDIGYVTGNIEKELKETYTQKSMAVNILDGHPNADLNRLYSQKLYKLISTMLLR